MKDEVLSEKIRQSKLYYWCVKIFPSSALLLIALNPLVDESHFLFYAIYMIVAFVLVLIDAGSLIYFSKKGLTFKGFYQDMVEMTKGDLLICAIGIAVGIYVKSTEHCIEMGIFAALVLSDHLMKGVVNKLKD